MAMTQTKPMRNTTGTDLPTSVATPCPLRLIARVGPMRPTDSASASHSLSLLRGARDDSDGVVCDCDMDVPRGQAAAEGLRTAAGPECLFCYTMARCNG